MEIGIELGRRYTYADFLTWIDGIRRELIDGIIHLMGAPLRIHQEVSMRISARLFMLLECDRGDCRVYAAPFAVRLPVGDEEDEEEIRTVVEPDICVICDESKLRRGGCVGAPDLVIEILSGSSLRHDADRKFHLYEAHGVREYWIVDPVGSWIDVFILGVDGHYDAGTTYESGLVPISVLGGLSLELSDIFKQ